MRPIFTIYNIATGEISAQYSGNDIDANTPLGFAYIKGSFDGLNMKVVDGNVVSKTTAELDEIIIQNFWDDLRSKRNIYLDESDWTQVPDSPLSDEKKAEWRIYRQSLRDITNTLDPLNITWPSQPT